MFEDQQTNVSESLKAVARHRWGMQFWRLGHRAGEEEAEARLPKLLPFVEIIGIPRAPCWK